MRRVAIGSLAVVAFVVLWATAALAEYPPSPSPSPPSGPSPTPTVAEAPTVLPTTMVSPSGGAGGGGVEGVEVVRPGAGGIAFTGADVTWGMLLAAVLFVAGVVLLAAARRRSHTD